MVVFWLVLQTVVFEVVVKFGVRLSQCGRWLRLELGGGGGDSIDD